MATIAPAVPSPSLHERLQRIWETPPGLFGILGTVDHKKIGKRYLVTAFTFYLQNGRGNTALRKLGAVQEGVLRRSARLRGEYADQVLWSILKEDWGDRWIAVHIEREND